MLLQLLQVPEFTKFLAAAATNERCQNLKLRDFLIKPVQRMCKYPLFLKEMLKYADKVHPDFRYLNTASESISTLTQEIEDSMSEVRKNSFCTTVGVALLVPAALYMCISFACAVMKLRPSRRLKCIKYFCDCAIRSASNLSPRHDGSSQSKVCSSSIRERE